MTNAIEEVDLTEVEAWIFEIAKVEAGAIQARLTRALTETRLNGSVAGLPPGEPRAEPWTFRPDGGLAFRPSATTPLEGRLYRVIEAFLPTVNSGAAGRETIEWPEETARQIPPAAFRRDLRKREGDLKGADFTYREAAVRVGGRVAVDERNGWPLYWTLRISGLRLEGGDLAVETSVTLTATKATIRGKSVGLPEKAPG